MLQKNKFIKIQYISINKTALFAHEKITIYKLNQVLTSMKEKGYDIQHPIVVDKNNNIIIDGHHRYNACMILGIYTIPVIYIDYINDRNIGFASEQKLKKSDIIKSALKEKLFPPKTTRHYVMIKNIQYPLSLVH